MRGPPRHEAAPEQGAQRAVPGVAKAAPASSHVASNFPMPETLGGDFADVHKDPTVRDAIKLRNLLHAFGEFPRYRLLTGARCSAFPTTRWRTRRSPTRAFTRRSRTSPTGSRSAIAHYRGSSACAPLLARWSRSSPRVDRAGMLFPFVKAGPNEVHAFEAFATVATNHAKGWFELFPDPPFGFLGEVEAVVKYHDAALRHTWRPSPGASRARRGIS